MYYIWTVTSLCLGIFNIREAHIENDLLKQIIADEYPHNVDLTIHFDGCKTAHCKHCKRFECDARAARFESENHGHWRAL